MAQAQLILGLLAALLWGVPVEAATYYVSTSGNDSNDGSSGSPWRNPQKCTLSGTPVVAGDTCVVRDGTYTNLGDGSVPGGFKGRVIVINSSSPVATAANPITIRSENPLGATIEVPNVWPGVNCDITSCPHAGFYISGGGSHYIIEGFQFTRPGSTQLTNASVAGITILTATTGVIIRHNHFHDIARTVCSESVFGNAGVFAQYQTDLLVENNIFNTIGRLRNGESGCVTTRFHHDHGLYVEVSTDATIRHNVFYDVTRGFAIDLKARYAGTKTLRAKIYNNTFSGDSPTTVPRGQIILVDVLDGVEIANNIFNDPEDGYVVGWGNSTNGSLPATATGGGILFKNNLTNSTRSESSMTNPSLRPTSGITYSGNLMNTSPGLVSAGTNDYRLAAGSAAINAGANVGLAYNGSAPDIGAYETLAFASCEVQSGATSTIRVTFENNAFSPLMPSTGATTFTARKNGSSNAVTGSVDRTGDSIYLIPVTNSYAGGDTVDISWSSGNITDSADIGNTYQGFVSTLTNQSCTNSVSGTSYAITQARYEYRGLYGPETTTDVRGEENVSSFELIKGGSVRIRFAITCSGADCPPTAFYLRYSLDGGGYTVVPDSFATDDVRFCGTSDPELGVSNGEVTTNQLSTAGTFTPGGVVLSSNAIPLISGLNNGYKTELEYCVQVDASASGTYAFRVYEQGGSALSAYTVTPSITIVPVRASTGF